MAVDDLQSKAAEMIKKVLTVGVGTIFLTEERLRTLVSEFKLPKELMEGLLESASKTRERFFTGLTQEFLAKVSEKTDVRELIDEFVSRYELDLNIKVNFRPRSKDKKAEVS
ncbi:MAG: hypothetical protein AB7P04_04610 [Bacteriovoracia bacterium]